MLGLGTDLVQIPRIQKLIDRFGDHFLSKIFTANEIAIALRRPEDKRVAFYAKRYAAKEAFSKAFGTGIGANCAFHDIEIMTNSQSGAPVVILSDAMNRRMALYYGERYKVMVSLSDDYPVAIATIAIVKAGDYNNSQL